MSATTELQSENGLFCPAWIKEICPAFQPFPIRHINARSTKLQDLKHSIITRGYDQNEPIILASSKDPKAQGYPMDGRNRTIASDMAFVETGIQPAITFKWEPVKDLAHAKLRQIAYESKWLLGKTPEDAAEHIITLYQEVKQLSPKILQDRSLDEFFETEGKIDDMTKLKAVVSRIQRYEKKVLQSQQPVLHHPNVSDSKSWGTDQIQNMNSGKEPVKAKTFKQYAGELENECDKCHKKQNLALNIKIFEDGTTKVERAA